MSARVLIWFDSNALVRADTQVGPYRGYLVIVDHNHYMDVIRHYAPTI